MSWSHRFYSCVATVLAGVIAVAGCGPKPTDPAPPKPTNTDAPVPLLDLLAKLPEDCWPKDGRDTLRCEKATAWYKSNVVGRRAVWPIPDDVNRDFLFSLNEKTGKYKANLRGGGPAAVKLFQREWRLAVWSPGEGGVLFPGFGLNVWGLSEPAAERLRKWAGEPPLEVTVTVGEVSFAQRNVTVEEAIVGVSVKDDVSLIGFSD